MNDLRAIAQGVQEEVVEWRRRLHRIPEPRWQEAKTISAIKAIIAEITDAATWPDFRKSIQIRDFQGGLIVEFWQPETPPGNVLFRADVDALPVREQTGLPFAPEPDGPHAEYMHACGHDAHMAMLLGFLKLVADGKVTPKHQLQLVFQRAEENPITQSGGDVLVNNENICNGTKSVHGFHVWHHAAPGVFMTREGAFLANSGRWKVIFAAKERGDVMNAVLETIFAMRGFDRRKIGATQPCSLAPVIIRLEQPAMMDGNVSITITSKGGHVARPEDGSNAIDIGVEVALSLQLLASQRDVKLQLVSFEAGNASNVRPAAVKLTFALDCLRLHSDLQEHVGELMKQRIRTVVAAHTDAQITELSVNAMIATEVPGQSEPHRVEVWFSLRNVLPEEERVRFVEAIEQKLHAIAAAQKDTVVDTIEVFKGHPTLFNTPASVNEVSQLLSNVGVTVKVADLEMGGEDFAHYLRKCSGSFWMLGTHKEGAGDHHSPTFDIDESVLWMGPLYWSLLATK